MSYVCSDIVQVWKVSEAMRQKWRCPVCKALPSSAVYISLMFQWIIWIQRHDEQDLIWPKGDVRKWSCGSKWGCPVCKALQRVFHQPPMSGRQERKGGQPAKSDKLNLDEVEQNKWAIVDEDSKWEKRARDWQNRSRLSWRLFPVLVSCQTMWFRSQTFSFRWIRCKFVSVPNT